MICIHYNHSVLFQPQGCLNTQTGLELQQQMASIAPERNQLWVLDLAKVEFVDSAGLSAIIAGLQMAQQNGCRLAVCNVCPSVRLVLEISQLDRALTVVDEPVAALTLLPPSIESQSALRLPRAA